MPDSDLIQKLIDAIAAGNDEATEHAALALAGKRALLPALRPLLATADPEKRWWAVRALALIEGSASTRLLIERLDDPDIATRCAAALGLGEQKASAAAPALIGRLADGSGWVRDSAADALAMIGEPAVPGLTAALSDPREGVRVRAAGALRRVLAPGPHPGRPRQIIAGHVPAITALYRALNDPNPLVRHNAYEALDKLGLLETVFVAPS